MTEQVPPGSSPTTGGLVLDEEITKAKRVLKVRLSPESQTTIRASVLVLTSTTSRWVRLPARAVSETADLVRKLVDIQPGIAIERVYSRWDGKDMRSWPDALWHQLQEAFRQRYLPPSPVELLPDDQDDAP